MSIYQEIWNADQQQNGIPAIRKSDLLSLKDESIGFAVIDEEASGKDVRVISEVVIPDSKRKTYDLCVSLFDNYILDPGLRENITTEESIEEREFIKAIIPTKPLQIAKDFIARDLGQEFTDLDLAVAIEKVWFLQGRAGSKYASGFEHVFVGEQKPTGNQPDDVAVKLGGYHFWYKYYLDDGGKIGDLEFDDRITYGGTRYGGASGRLVPEVVTINFKLNAPDTLNRSNQLLKKPIGGFWVGCSPEGLISLGLVRVLTSVGSQAVINSSTYKLEFFPLSDNPKSIRTLFPRFIRTDFVDDEQGEVPSVIDDSGDGEEAAGTESVRAGQVKIIAALVNPPGDEAGRETVTLLNTTDTAVDLDSWQIVAPNGWRLTFADVTIGGGDTRRFSMIASDPQFSNEGGTIALLESDGKVHDRVTYTGEQGSHQGMSIVF